MRKQTIASLTRKGFSQKKIAKTLGIRKMKVVTYQKTHKIGKRAMKRGAQDFWSDVRHERELYGRSWNKSKTKVKYSKKWFERRQARLTGIAKERDIYGEKWQRVKEGEIGEDWWKTEEGEELMEAAEYD
jgi:FixJ family two-component response regulator